MLFTSDRDVDQLGEHLLGVAPAYRLDLAGVLASVVALLLARAL